jgi:DNA-binding transcriptional regulator YbjK
MAPRRRHRGTALARREALLRATVTVAAARGTAGVTHRRVTEEAGVPLATVSYFFESIDALAAEALQVFAGARAAELLTLAETITAEGDNADEVAAALATAAQPPTTSGLAQVEAYLHAARVPAFRPAVAEAVAAFEHVATVALTATGVADPARLAAAFVALADGFALRALALPGSVEPTLLHLAFRALYLGAAAATSTPAAPAAPDPAAPGAARPAAGAGRDGEARHAP